MGSEDVCWPVLVSYVHFTHSYKLHSVHYQAIYILLTVSSHNVVKQ